MPARCSWAANRVGPGVMDEVVVRHHGERDVDVERRHLVEDRRRRDTVLERVLRRLLDDRAVHHRIGERDADLDGIGTVGRARSDRILPARDTHR